MSAERPRRKTRVNDSKRPEEPSEQAREREVKRQLAEVLRVLIAQPILSAEARAKLTRSLEKVTGEAARADVRAARLRKSFRACDDNR